MASVTEFIVIHDNLIGGTKGAFNRLRDDGDSCNGGYLPPPPESVLLINAGGSLLINAGGSLLINTP